jgi:non-lysosomal glucosylceramidase
VVVSGKGERRVYTGRSLRCLAMPMGGIGAGQIALCGDGSLRQWQIFNQANHLCYVPGSFFAIWASVRGKRPFSRILQTAIAHDEEGFTPAERVNDHVVPCQVRDLLRPGRGIENIEYIGEYPIAELRYIDKGLPVEVRLEAFSPMIPLDSKNSGLPAIIFNFTVRNPNLDRAQVSLAAMLQNAVGYDGVAHIAGVRSPLYGQNVNQPLGIQGISGVAMSKLGLARDDPGYGTMALAYLGADGCVRLRWDDVNEPGVEFARNGRFSDLGSSVPSPEGQTWNAGVAAPFALEPGEERTVTFVIAWHFPNRYVNWTQRWFGGPDGKNRLWLGNMYSNWFADAGEVVRYVRDNCERLCRETRLFRDTLYDASLPYRLLDRVSSQLSTIRSPSCMWTEDGRLYGFEGCHGASTGHGEVGGCCPMNCTHVWNYAQALAKVFPDLERTMRETDLFAQMDCCGGIPHRTVLPLELRRWSSCDPAAGVEACDGHFGTILKTYREYLVYGEREYLEKVWPRIKLAMQYAFNRWDPDGDGVCDKDCPQWNTYDLNYYGWNSLSGTYYLAALRAAEEMAKRIGDKECAGEYRRRFESGREIIATQLWNGEYYVQKHDARKYPRWQYADGCLSDQVIGQWWAHVLGLGYILPPAQVKKALQSIYKYNFRRNFKGFVQQPRVFASENDRGLLMCTWPKGGRPKEPMYYCDEVWTGTEYQVAAHMLYEGLAEEAMAIVRAASDRYNGEYRNPWNEVECGDHYVRPMSSWSLLEAAGGYRWDGPAKTIHIGPNLGAPYRAFFITDTGWGTIGYESSARRVGVKLHVAQGAVTVKTVAAKSDGRRPSRVRASVEGKPVAGSLAVRDGQAIVTLKRSVSLNSGSTLAIDIS